MSIKINYYYQYFAFLIAVLCIATGVVKENWLLVGIGCPIMIWSFATIIHIRTGKHNSISKLPPDIKINKN